MAYVVLGILLLVVLVFGFSSGMNSYASAQQAQAAIEQARAVQDVATVAQINAWGNVVLTLALLTIIAVIIGLVVFGIYLWSRVNGAKKSRAQSDVQILPGMPSKQSLDMMLQMGMLQMLQRMNGEQPVQLLEVPKEEEVEPDAFHWLSR